MRITLKIIVLSLFVAMLGPKVFSQAKEKPTVIFASNYVADTASMVSDYYLRGIKELEDGGNIEKALAYFQTVLELNPMHAASSFQVAKLLTDPKEAIKYSYRSTRIEPNNIWYKYQLGALYTSTKSYQKAIELWRDIISREPSNSQLYRYLAALYETTGQPIAAISVIDSALQRAGDDFELLEYKQQLLGSSYQSKQATENAKLMVELYPNEPLPLLHLAASYEATRQDSLAKTYFEKALAIDSTDIQVLIPVSEYYTRSGKESRYLDILNDIFASKEVNLDAKIDYFKSTLSNATVYRRFLFKIDNLIRTLRLNYLNNYEVDKLYAQHLINIGKTEEAVAVYKQHLSVAEEAKTAYREVIAIESYLGHTDSVSLYMADALRLNPDDYELPMIHASMLFNAERYSDAINTLKNYMPKLPSDSTRSIYYGFIGDIYDKAGSPKKRYKMYDKALSFDANNINVLNNYSYFLSVDGTQLEKALKMASKVMEHDGSNPTYIDTYAWVLYKLGQYKEARVAMRKAIALEENPSSELYLHYGDILYKLGETSTASIYWDKAEKAGAEPLQIAKRKRGELE